MDDIRDLRWSDAEKKAARKAFKTAYERECRAIGVKVRKMMADDSDPQYLWRIHDYLSKQRRATDQKYDYRYSVLIEVFGRLLSECLLSRADLSGLSQDKIARIIGFANFFSGRDQ